MAGVRVTHQDEEATIWTLRPDCNYVAFERKDGSGNYVVNSCPSIDLVLKVAEKIKERASRNG